MDGALGSYECTQDPEDKRGQIDTLVCSETATTLHS